MTDGLGVDVAIEAVGVPLTFEMATELIRPGGTVANVGVHGTSVELKLQDLWIKDVAFTTGLVSGVTTPMLLKLVAQGRLTPQQFVSHRFPFDAILDDTSAGRRRPSLSRSSSPDDRWSVDVRRRAGPTRGHTGLGSSR